MKHERHIVVVHLLVLLSACAFAQAESFLVDEVTTQANGANIARGAVPWEVTFQPGEYPNVTWLPPGGLWDWSNSGGLLIDAENPGDSEITVHLRIDNPGADGTNACNRASLTLPPRSRRELRVRVRANTPEVLWGMRGLPGRAPEADGPALDLKSIIAFQVFLHHPSAPQRIHLHRVERLPATPAMTFPFVDRFGQYRHAEWPGKVIDEDDLRARALSEPLPDAAIVNERDRYGGWPEGPRVDATGWFRTEQQDGRWWLVTPEGSLFFSMGVDCVGAGEYTFVESRETWFEWLPTQHDPVFGRFLGSASGAHSLSGIQGGAGRTFSFYCANLARKFGDRWRSTWQRRAYQRLRAWNFNTLGNWAQADVLQDSPLPYVVSCALTGLPVITKSVGHWAKMHDVFAPGFRDGAETQIAEMIKGHRDRPLCLGYFVDNELSWEGVIEGVLRSPSTQPARQELLRFLLARHKDITAINNAWGAQLASLDALAPGVSDSEMFRRDLDDFLHHFARAYFEIVVSAIRKRDPNHLYLGCRFAAAPDPVVRAAAEFADVVSFNLYRPAIDCAPLEAIGKPVIIGEFHFGATDRGLFHPGISATRTQEERAVAYTAYMNSAANCPAVVGAHWFQFVDEPITGRWHDGENYNIGLVDVTDSSYPLLVSAAASANARIYEVRSGAQVP